VSQQRALVKEFDRAPSKKKNSRSKKKSLTFSIKCDLSGNYELYFEGSMTKPFLAANSWAISSISGRPAERAFIDLMQVKQIDDSGIDFLLKLMKKIEREGVRFQLIYNDGQVGSKVESSGLTSYFAKPTWVYR